MKIFFRLQAQKAKEDSPRRSASPPNIEPEENVEEEEPEKEGEAEVSKDVESPMSPLNDNQADDQQPEPEPEPDRSSPEKDQDAQSDEQDETELKAMEVNLAALPNDQASPRADPEPNQDDGGPSGSGELDPHKRARVDFEERVVKFNYNREAPNYVADVTYDALNFNGSKLKKIRKPPRVINFVNPALEKIMANIK